MRAAAGVADDGRELVPGPAPGGAGRLDAVGSGRGGEPPAFRSAGLGARTCGVSEAAADGAGGVRHPAAALYHERWEIETACDEVKTHLLGPGAQLRSKTPDLVMQEFDGLMLAHYAVRCLIQEAADQAGEDPDRLSFLHAVNVIRRRIVHPGGFPPGAGRAGA